MTHCYIRFIVTGEFTLYGPAKSDGNTWCIFIFSGV